ncbi:MAG: peptide-binding protein [Phycisphaeraceae bacterium]
MENRFGVKDLIFTLLLIAFIVTVWLAMYQFDRQWETLRNIESSLDEQRTTLMTLSERLRSGAVAPAGNPGEVDDSAYNPEDDPFYRIREARKQSDFAFGGWYIDNFKSTLGKLTPLVSTDAAQTVVEEYVLESLIKRDPETFEWRPWIAERWEVAEDGLTITYDLRENVVFSDGEPLTSEDVVFTYDQIMNPEINAPALRVYLENVESVEADGPHRVIFHLERPYFLSLGVTGGMAILPRHYYERFTPEEFNTEPGLLVGSGPYMLPGDPENWQPGTGKVEVVRNANYWGPRPSFDRLVWREITDETAELVAFRNGKIDRYSVPPEKYERLRDDADLLARAEKYEYMAPTFGYRFIGWNQSRSGEPTMFADRRVRRAMTLLVDREEMAEQLMAGLAVVADGPFNPLGEQAAPEIDPLPYDPERAKELLAEAGWVDRDGDGVLENQAGGEFRFELVFPANLGNYEQMAFYLKDAYARAGIVMSLGKTEWNTMKQRLDERSFDAITLGWTGSIEGDPKQIFHSDSIAGGGSNHVSYRSEELDRLIDEARQTLDKDERMAMWHEAHQILHEDQPYTFLFFSKAVVFVDQRIRNVEVTQSGMNERTELYVPAELQRWSD